MLSNMTSATYRCPMFGNTDANLIGFIHGKPYCRKCISFRGEVAKDDYHLPKDADFSISYELSYEQKVLSWKLIENYKKGIDTLVYAVCGRPKTRKT